MKTDKNIEWIQIDKSGDKFTLVMNLPNGALIRTVACSALGNAEALEFVPEINYNKDENKFVRIY